MAVHPTYDRKDDWDLGGSAVKLSERLSFAGKEKYKKRVNHFFFLIKR